MSVTAATYSALLDALLHQRPLLPRDEEETRVEIEYCKRRAALLKARRSD